MKLLLLCLIPSLTWSYVEPTVIKTSFTTVSVVSSGTLAINFSSGTAENPLFMVSTGIPAIIRSSYSINTQYIIDTIRSSDSYTSTGNGTSINISTHPMRDFGLLVYGDPVAPTSYDVRCEGSIDGVNFSQIVANTNAAPGNTGTIWSGTSRALSLHFRTRVAGLVLGTANGITAMCLGGGQ